MHENRIESFFLDTTLLQMESERLCFIKIVSDKMRVGFTPPSQDLELRHLYINLERIKISPPHKVQKVV